MTNSARVLTERGERLYSDRTPDIAVMSPGRLYSQAEVGSPKATYCTSCGYDTEARTDLFAVLFEGANDGHLVRFECPDHAETSGATSASIAALAQGFKKHRALVCGSCFMEVAANGVCSC
jgi:hypothetical protein